MASLNTVCRPCFTKTAKIVVNKTFLLFLLTNVSERPLRFVALFLSYSIICSFLHFMLYSVFNDHAFSGVTTVAVVQWAQCGHSPLSRQSALLPVRCIVPFFNSLPRVQWAQVDSNHRPHKHEVFSYQARAVYVRASYGIEAMPLWWAQVDSNHRPRAYQARALTC